MSKQSLENFSPITQKTPKSNVQQQQSNKQAFPQKKIHKLRGPPKGSKRKPNLAAGIKTGIWTINEMKGYLKFITRFESHFQDKATRKKKKIFHRMSNFIKSRTAQQCRSHHQKLELKFNSHQEIIDFIKNEIELKLQEATQKLSAFNKQQDDEAQQKIVIKAQNIEDLQSTKHAEKKTSLKSESFYEVIQTRQGLQICISVQGMQSWQY